MPRTRAGETIGDWRELTSLVTPEIAAELPYLVYIRNKLVARLAEIEELARQRDYHEARKQELSKQISKSLPEGRREATLLRNTLKDHYGPESEKLARFGIQPFRGKRKRGKPE